MRTDSVIIKPRNKWISIDFNELWKYRELLYFLVWRDVKVRYKQTVIGAGWAIIQPFVTMIIFTIFFGNIAKIPSDGVPYPIFSYSGLLLWIYFSTSVSSSSNSVVGSSNLITKVYFPRLIIPLTSSLAGMVDYCIAFIILVLMMIYYGITPGFSIIFLPIVLFLTFITATGFGLWFSSLNVKYRDVRHALPFFIQLLLFATPVIYPLTFVPEKYRWLLSLNPMSGIIEVHRACILGNKSIDLNTLSISVSISLIIFISGLFYFRRTERFFADII